MTTIYKQLESLSPEEIEFLKTTIPLTLDNSINVLHQQKTVLNELRAVIKKYEGIIYTKDVVEDATVMYAKDNIPRYVEAIEANIKKVELLKSINDKFKLFEGII